MWRSQPGRSTTSSSTGEGSARAPARPVGADGDARAHPRRLRRPEPARARRRARLSRARGSPGAPLATGVGGFHPRVEVLLRLLTLSALYGAGGLRLALRSPRVGV